MVKTQTKPPKPIIPEFRSRRAPRSHHECTQSHALVRQINPDMLAKRRCQGCIMKLAIGRTSKGQNGPLAGLGRHFTPNLAVTSKS